MLRSALYLPAGPFVEPQETLVGGIESIQDLTEGVFDAVRREVKNGVLVGYVNDNALFDEMPFNYLATAMFGQSLYGPCVLVWGTNPEGEYDGEDYDLPAWFVDFATTTFLQGVADAYNDATAMTVIFGIAIEHEVLTREENDRVLDAMEAHARGHVDADEYNWAMQLTDDILQWAEDNLTEDMIDDYTARHEQEEQ